MLRQLGFHIYFLASLSVGGMASASTSIAIDRDLGEQIFSLLLILYQKIAETFSSQAFWRLWLEFA
jgi:hypothetical protein